MKSRPFHLGRLSLLINIADSDLFFSLFFHFFTPRGHQNEINFSLSLLVSSVCAVIFTREMLHARYSIFSRLFNLQSLELAFFRRAHKDEAAIPMSFFFHFFDHCFPTSNSIGISSWPIYSLINCFNSPPLVFSHFSAISS